MSCFVPIMSAIPARAVSYVPLLQFCNFRRVLVLFSDLAGAPLFALARMGGGRGLLFGLGEDASVCRRFKNQDHCLGLIGAGEMLLTICFW
jgi:hypothetical protein